MSEDMTTDADVAFPALSEQVRDVPGLFGAFNVFKQLRREASKLAKTKAGSDDDHANATRMLVQTHQVWQDRLRGQILADGTAEAFALDAPKVDESCGPLTLAAACSIELAFLKGIVDGPGFALATEAQELNARRARIELAAESEKLSAGKGKDGEKPGTYL